VYMTTVIFSNCPNRLPTAAHGTTTVSLTIKILRGKCYENNYFNNLPE
jgi:hypothetical protein